MAVLLDMGFEPARPGPERIEDTILPSGDHKLVLDRRAMSTRVSVAAIHHSRCLLEDAAGRAFEEMDRLIALLNRFDSVSAVGVLPLVDLLKQAGGSPEPVVWRDTLETVGADALRVSAARIAFERDGMGITLDGIAKGYIVDAMAAVLEAHGIDRFLIDAGGDIRAAGLREDALPWVVAVRDPRHGEILPSALRMTEGAVATSGGYEARFDPDGSWHHIVSPRTGRSPDDVLSVTVTGPTAFASDALATAALLMSPREGVRFIDAVPGFECMVIDAAGYPALSAGWTGRERFLNRKV
ncbi:MAG: FAD:protein FMN transferase [Gemmatimonadales bacterium]